MNCLRRRANIFYQIFGLMLLCSASIVTAKNSPLFRFRPNGFLTRTKFHESTRNRQEVVGDLTNKATTAGNKLPQRISRGGACSDSNPILFLKIGASAALETLALLGLFKAGKEVSNNSSIPWTWSKWVAILSTVFGSSLVGSLIDGGVSAASKQAFDPNAIPGDADWYEKLEKPKWNPPGWVFPIMWLVISKPTQALALNELLDSSNNNQGAIPWGPLSVYCAHLSLGDAWNKIFFGMQCIGRGAGVITGFFGSLLTSTYLFFKVDPKAGKFLLPTCGWVTVATALNWSIFFKNK